MMAMMKETNDVTPNAPYATVVSNAGTATSLAISSVLFFPYLSACICCENGEYHSADDDEGKNDVKGDGDSALVNAKALVLWVGGVDDPSLNPQRSNENTAQ